VRISTNTENESLITTITSHRISVRLVLGAVESAIKQIGRRIKISGAQWNPRNVPQVLAHRVAYLNGMIGVNPHAAT
jgi:hypothetical protein